MAERIINITCPNCKHGIKHDTLMSITTVTPPEEYPVKNEAGRYWCEACQHGANPNEDGLCMTCLNRGRTTRLRPKVDKGVEPKSALKVEDEPEDTEDVFEPKVTLAKAPVESKSKKKRIDAQKATK